MKEKEKENANKENMCLFGSDFNDEAWKKEWQDMPEFVQENQQAFKQVIVSFESQKDVDDFSKFINQKITEDTKSLWFPKYSREKPSNFLYINES